MAGPRPDSPFFGLDVIRTQTTWSIDDYDAMSWHDNHVHGIRIVEGEHGAGELVVDLDYILEWITQVDERPRFRVAPATLTFHEVSDLRIALDYAKSTAAVSPFSLHAIEREKHVFSNGHTSYRWHLEINWPDGAIDFIATGFTQVLSGESVEGEGQRLEPSRRIASDS